MMRKFSLLAISIVFLVSCGDSTRKAGEEEVSQNSVSFPASYTAVGENFTDTEILDVQQMKERYKDLEVGDTVQVKFKSSVNSVCKNKGCWMRLDMEDGEEAMVKFKDYAFFVPKDIEEKDVVVSGKAYITEMSVEEQRHFAEDGGQSPKDIAAITKPKQTLSFLAEGVVIED